MIKSVNDYSISDIFSTDKSIIYAVPKYQREYTWTYTQWENLFDDIVENESGYFLGSIICINQTTDALAVQKLEVVDGQQRLTTLSLLLAALYQAFKNIEAELDDDQRLELLNLKRKLVLKNTDSQFRVIPQVQNNNHDDYRAILSEIGVITRYNTPLYAGNRKIFKAFRYFRDRIDKYVSEQDNKLVCLLSLLERINQAVLVKIEVFSHADAYTLFESLNNRGMPLTAIDLIKNALLARLEGKDSGRIDYYFDQWNQLLNYLTDDYSLQERFFRHYYNAFKNRLNDPFRNDETKKKDPLGYVATRTNLMQIYQELIKLDPKSFLDDILESGKLYSIIIGNSNEQEAKPYEKAFRDLDQIQGTPSHLFMLYLFKHKNVLQLTDAMINQIILLLTKFFVRRNLTDIPSTRDLTKIFMTMIEAVEAMTGTSILDYVRSQLISVSVSDAVFEEKLKSSIYEDNYGATRFILCSLAEQGMTKETFVDLWQYDKKQYAWTVEHIFPQGENIPPSWISMIADGDEAIAKQYREEYTHTIGNLTISGFNSTLGNKSFEEKRDRVDTKGNFVGYKNGLKLNEDLKDEIKWTIDKIKARTEKLVNQSMNIFSLT